MGEKKRKQRIIMARGGYYSVNDIAKAAGVGVGTVYRMLDEGRLRGLRNGRAVWINLDSAVEAWSELPPIAANLKALAMRKSVLP